jgi:type II secretory pathway pseudopilin PulG
MKRHNRVAGLSLIELVVFVAIVGVLGEIIIPYFMNQTTYARFVAMNAVAGALNSGVYMTIKKYQAQHSSTSNTVVLEGKPVKVIPGFGFPTGAKEGIGSVVRIFAGFHPTYSTITQYDLSPSVPNCHVTYDSSSGQVHLLTTGC